jgi:putative ABC transport system permease protein
MQGDVLVERDGTEIRGDPLGEFPCACERIVLVLRLVLKEGGRLVWIGLLIGAPGIYLTRNLIRGLLVGVSPSDRVALLAAAFGLALVAVIACYVPARRALRIEPAQLLRQE